MTLIEFMKWTAEGGVDADDDLELMVAANPDLWVSIEKATIADTEDDSFVLLHPNKLLTIKRVRLTDGRTKYLKGQMELFDFADAVRPEASGGPLVPSIGPQP